MSGKEKPGETVTKFLHINNTTYEFRWTPRTEGSLEGTCECPGIAAFQAEGPTAAREVLYSLLCPEAML